MTYIIMNKNLSKTIRIGSLCVSAYLASYVTRNILSVSSPEMIGEAFFSKEYVGLLSSVCYIFYALGQLFNGFIGDKVHPRYMLAIGFCISGIMTVLVPISNIRALHFICFACIGYSLSMLRGPLTKVISESTDIRYARIICTILNMAGFAGPIIASLLSLFMHWRAVFFIVGIITVVIGVICFVAFTVLSAKGEIVFKKDASVGFKSLFEVFRIESFIFYMSISAVSEVLATSITFWIPTYSTEHLGFSAETSSLIYSIMSFSTLLAPFISLFIYDYILRDAVKLSLIMYVAAAVFFIAVRFIAEPYVNITMFILGRLAGSCAAGVVWSVYIPGLAESGKVSSANGVIDAAGYLMASIANAVFSGLLNIIGWNGIKTVWYLIMAFGAGIAAAKLLSKKAAR